MFRCPIIKGQRARFNGRLFQAATGDPGAGLLFVIQDLTSAIF